MSDVKQRPIKATADANDWLVVQSDNAGLGDEKRVQISQIGGGGASSSATLLTPSGDTTGVADKTAIQTLIDTLSSNGGGIIQLIPGDYYFWDVDIKSGITIECPILPTMNFNQVCPDLGFNPTTPFLGGARIRGVTGNETIFSANTNNLTASGSTVNPLDVAISGVRLCGLVGVNCGSLLTAGAQDHNGLAFSSLEYLFGYKISGTLIDLVNPQHVNGRYFKAIDANHVFRCGAFHSACQPGNSYFSDIYNYSFFKTGGVAANGTANTDWAIKLDARQSAGAGTNGGSLNYVTLNGRIQCNAFRDTALNRTRLNSAIVIEGTATTKVNACAVLGTDIEGYSTYGLFANYCNNLTLRTDGFAGNAQHVAAIKIKNCQQVVIQSNNLDTTLHIDQPSTVSLTGFLRYYARDNNEASGQSSAHAIGLYKVFAECTNTAEPPTYTPIKTNGVQFLQLGSSNSYNIQLSESENVIRRKLVPMAETIQTKTGNFTWSRWEAGVVLLSGAASTQTLPVVDAALNGVQFTFKSTDANSHTITGQSSQQIDGAATYTLPAGGSVTLTAISSGTRWVITSKS